jgi:hypothetical protein
VSKAFVHDGTTDFVSVIKAREKVFGSLNFRREINPAILIGPKTEIKKDKAENTLREVINPL